MCLILLHLVSNYLLISVNHIIYRSSWRCNAGVSRKYRIPRGTNARELLLKPAEKTKGNYSTLSPILP